MLHVDGWDVTQVGLLHRKSLLKAMLDYRGALRFTTHRVGAGERYAQEACEKGWEGIIAKLATSPYEHGRSRAWLKLKCVLEQEFVIGGYTEPQGSRDVLGALLVGYYRGRDLIYAGKVGTGFDDETLADLSVLLSKIERADLAVRRGQGPAAQGGPLGQAHPGGAGRVRRMDRRRPPPPLAVPRASHRQGRPRGGP